MIIIDKNLMGNDLFTDINLLNIEMKALHTPRELQDKLTKFDFSEYNLVNEVGNQNNRSSFFNVNNNEIKNLIPSSKAYKKINHTNDNNKTDKSLDKKEIDYLYKKVNIKSSLNSKRHFNNSLVKNSSPLPNTSRNYGVKNLTLNASKKNTIESVKNQAPVQTKRKLDKFLNYNNNDKKLTALQKIDFKNTLRNYNNYVDSNSKSPATTRHNRNKSTDNQLSRDKSNENQQKKTTKTFSKKKNFKNTLSYDYISENAFIKQIKLEKENIMKVIDSTFGNQMEHFTDDAFESFNQADKSFLIRTIIETLYIQRTQINDLEKSINDNYKKTILNQEEKIAYLIDEINSLKYSVIDRVKDEFASIKPKEEPEKKWTNEEGEKLKTKDQENEKYAINKKNAVKSAHNYRSKNTSKTPDKPLSTNTLKKTSEKGRVIKK